MSVPVRPRVAPRSDAARWQARPLRRRQSIARRVGTLLRLASGAGTIWIGILCLGAAHHHNDFVYASLGVALMILGCYLVIGDGRE